MGKPKGEGARSKVRASSSSLAASLAQGSGALTAGFGGYVGGTKIDAGPNDDAYLNIDAESAANLRRLSKKDSTTKLKALVALTAFFQEHSAAEVSALLPCWVYEYKKLVQDNNRQVREATHKAMSCLATAVGRSLAPHLRSLMGAWWMGHFDPFYEVSTAAKQALEIAFPGQKRLEALAYCANDIFIYIDENLKLTPQTISDKNVPLEESTEKHERVVSSSLFALSALLGILFTASSCEKEKHVPVILQFFKDHKMFQSLLKSGSPRIRSGVYEALKSYLQYVPEAITGDTVESAAKLILGSFSEKDITCHQAMWDMILLFTRHFGHTWGAKKVVHQRFWAFLRHGCYGSQKISYPCLLPLLSIVPSSALAPAHEFFVEFFSNLWKGRDEVVFPRDDGSLLLKVVQECFLWVVQQEEKYSSAEGFEKGSLQKTLVESTLLGLIWRTYLHEDTEEKFLLLRSEIGTCIVDIFESLEGHTLTTFWTSLREDCLASLLMNESHKNARMLHFFLKLNNGISSEDKRARILGCVVKPFVAEGFPFVKQMEERESLKLFSSLVSSYGSRAFDLLASLSWKGERYDESTQEETQTIAEVFVSKQLHYFFRSELLPWCVDGSNELKIGMLLTFLEEPSFFKEWEYVVTFLLESEDAVCISSLETMIRTFHQRCQHNELQRWRSPQVENKVLSVAAGGKLFDPSCYALIRTTMAGVQKEGTYYFIVREETLIEIVNALLKAAISVVYLSQNQAAISLAESICPWAFGDVEPSTFENAKAALSILLSRFESFAFLEESNRALSRFTAIIFCLYWAFVPEVEDDNASDDEVEVVIVDEEDGQSSFTSTLRQAHRSIESLCRMLSSHCKVQELVIRGVNKVVSEGADTEYADRWVLDCMKLTCFTHADVQRALDVLLASTDYWPFWTTASTCRKSLDVQKYTSLSAIVYKVGRALGPATLFLGGDEVSHARPWLIVELLCAWEFASAVDYVVPFLQLCAREDIGSAHSEVLVSVLNVLFHEAAGCVTMATDDPYVRALLAVLRALFVHDGPFGRKEGEKMFVEYISGSESTPALPLKFLPYILEVLMPALTKGTAAGAFSTDVEFSICSWLKLALNAPSLFSRPSSDGIQWMQVVVACFPIETNGGTAALCAASKADVSQTRKNMLLFLLRKQVYTLKDTNFEGTLEESSQLLLARLIAAAVAYCWKSFGSDEWTFVVAQLKEWIEHGVLRAEEFTEAIVENMSETGEVERSSCYDEISTSLLSTALISFSLMQALKSLDEATDSESYKAMDEAHWPGFEGRAAEHVLRLFFASGLMESISSINDATRRKIALQRQEETCLWDRVADIALNSSGRVREAAVRAVDLWGVGKSGISALYSILFSPHPISSLQWLSYNFLSTHPLQHQAVTWKPVSSGTVEGDQSDVDFQADSVFDDIRPELLSILGTPATELYESALSSTRQAHYFLAWSILLSHLLTLETTSPARERLLQYVKDTDISSTVLDCLLQHIPLRKVTVEKKVVVESSPAAEAAKRSASTGSVFFAAEALLWGGDNVNNLEVIAGALFGLLLKVLPACVQTWFIGLKDRGTVAGIEAFTTENCSPYLLTEEFNQVQASAISDTNVLIKANRSTREVTATYKTDEAGMDIVIKMPACYPLKPVEMDCTRKLGISETRLRKWMLSMAAFLRNQNGCLSEAVLIWKRNIDREFEGVEECPICYSIIHTVNHSLPRLACKTCRHKFHGACLYKWFSSSHKSTCPLCQTPF